VDKPAIQWLSYDPGLILDLKSENIKMLQEPSALDVNGEATSILDKSLQYNDAYLLLDKKYIEISKLRQLIWLKFLTILNLDLRLKLVLY
jgi:hypothetical protein